MNEPSSLARALRACLLLVVLAPASARADNAAPPSQLVDALVGRWRMTGTVRGRPVTYAAEGTRVLGGRFVDLHMIDATNDPPKYEARVSLGVDDRARELVAHWLDTFGAAPSRTLGTGRGDARGWVLTFPYVDGTFRDTFTFDPDGRRWTLLIEAAQPDGAWREFARYEARREAGKEGGLETTTPATAPTAPRDVAAGEGIIIPFDRVDRIAPGRTRASEVVAAYGKARKVKREGTTEIHSYPSRGMTLIYDRTRPAADPIVDGIYVESPWAGRSPNGLRLGMPRDEALAICRRDYVQKLDLGTSFYFASTAGGDSKFQLWFEGDRLIRMKIFGE